MSPVVARALLVLATLACVIAALGAWADRELLDTDQFTKSSVAILQDPAVQATTAAYLADQLVDGRQVADRLRDALPPRLSPLAGPLSAGAGELAERTVRRVLASGAFQSLWEDSTRAAHRELVALVEDDDGLLARNGVVLDLRPQLGVLAERLGVTGAATGDKAIVRILRGDELDAARRAVDALHALRWISAALAVLLLVAAVAVAPDRARGLANAGIALIVGALLLLVARRVGGREVVAALTDDGAAADAARAVWRSVTELLAQIAGTGIVLGAACLVGGWLAGASAWAARARAALTPGVVDHPELVFGAALATVAALLAAGLLPAASRPVAILIYLVLVVGGVWALRRQMIQERAA